MNVLTAVNPSNRVPRFVQVAAAISKLIFYTLRVFTKLKPSFVFLGIRQAGKAVDSESIMHRFEPCIPNY